MLNMPQGFPKFTWLHTWVTIFGIWVILGVIKLDVCFHVNHKKCLVHAYHILYMEVDTRRSIHITEKAGSYHMSSENWQINLKACQTLRSQSSDAFFPIWSSSVTRVDELQIERNVSDDLERSV